MELTRDFKGCRYLGKSLKIFKEAFLSPKTKNKANQILRELFLKPYLPSKELCRKFDIGKEDLKRIYVVIRASREARKLFEFSPFYYLTKVLENLSKDSVRTSRILKGERPFPLAETMEVFISENCNAKCKFCYRNGKLYDEGRVLSTQEYVNLINEFADLGGQNLDVSGGLEPLLSPSVTEVLKAGLSRDLKVNLYTNGIALNKLNIVDCLMKIFRVRVSLNAYDRDSYREIMGVDKFGIVTKNLKDLVGAKKASNSRVRIGTSYVAFKENYKGIHEAVKLAQKLGLDFFDLRSVEVTDLSGFDEKRRKELTSILRQIREESLSGAYGKLSISVADTFNSIIDPDDDYMKYLKKDLVNALRYFRLTVTPYGRIYALNLIGQPSKEDNRYLLGKIGGHARLPDILLNRKTIPFVPESLLSHDITLVSALSKLESELEFGIGLKENPFNWD
jgi:MoaA/NifB/PqqE/SkfB family radical SAM enzyme